MMMPEKVRGMTPYTPTQGDYAIRLDANESFLPLSGERIQRAVERVLSNRYPDPYCARLCERFAAYYGIHAEGVVMGNGSDELISILLSCLLSKGDTVLVPEMDFSMYRFYADLYECRAVTVRKAKSLQMDVDAVIEAALRERARMVIFSNPCNPTSLLLPRDQVLRLLDALDCIVVIDEAYMEFAGDHSVMALAEANPRLVVLKTFSKAFGLAGIRLGAAIAGETIASALRAVKSPYNVNALSQAVGEEALSDFSALSRNIGLLCAERDFLLGRVRELAARSPRIAAVHDSATNFLFFRAEGAEALYERLKSQGILVRLMGEHIRVTAGNRAENERFLRALAEWLK